MSLRSAEELLKVRLLMRLMRHVETLCEPHLARREVEMQVEVEVAIGLDEASLPNWHGSRRNAEVISGSKTTVSQSLGPGRFLHRGNPTCNKAKGSAGVSKVARFPSFGRISPGDALVTVTSHSRPCATPNKAEASLNQDVSCSTPSSNPSASFITEIRIHVAVSSMRQITLQGWQILFSGLSGPVHLVCYPYMHAHRTTNVHKPWESIWFISLLEIIWTFVVQE